VGRFGWERDIEECLVFWLTEERIEHPEEICNPQTNPKKKMNDKNVWMNTLCL